MQSSKALRNTQITLSFLLGTYVLFVAFNNLTDYWTNYEFVRVVTSMSKIFTQAEGMVPHWRSITATWAVHAMYVFIILMELLIGYLCIRGGAAMLKAGADASFAKAKAMSIYGALAGVVLWFGVFIIVGSEWFLMWQSKDWNAGQSAYNLLMFYSVSLVILLKD